MADADLTSSTAFNDRTAALSRPAGDPPRLLLDALLLGVVGAVSALLFTWLLGLSQRFFLGWIAAYDMPGMPGDGGLTRSVGPHGPWLIPLVTTLGGLLSGALVYTFAPEAEGHGTDTVVKALHWTGGDIRKRVAPLKMIASAITIGSGGSAGREGPTALIAAGVGSMYADWFKRSERERRLLVLMGMAAGLSAIFRSPIGTAIFAVEVLYSGIDFETEALLYCMISAIVAYALNGLVVGWGSLFQVPPQFTSKGLADFGSYIALGLASGLVATVLPEVFYRVRDGFHSLRIPAWTRPGLGGLLLGLLALRLPQLLGGGYVTIQHAIDGRLGLELLLVLMVGKVIALSLTVSSGGSGGIFAPSLFVGAMLGGVFAHLSHNPPAGLVLVGMAAVFGAAARVPIATLLMVAEMTGGYQLLVPTAMAVMLSFVIQRYLSAFLRYDSLYEAQVVSRSDSPGHRAEQARVALRLLDQGSIVLPGELTHLHLAGLLSSGISLELPGGSELMVGALKPESPWTGRSIGSRTPDEATEHAEITAVLRGRRALPVTPQTVLQPGDRLLLIAEPGARASLDRQLNLSQAPPQNSAPAPAAQRPATNS